MQAPSCCYRGSRCWRKRYDRTTKLRIGDANTMMAEGGIQAADKENDSPVQHYLDCFGGGHFAAKPELVKRLVMELRMQLNG